ncbi:hypothetical protein [Halalkalibacter urbisdiaboli]|uniref:hypothetical protein n=1 Tax=Halalkalibacter urbisdiaboli TaxID=1960589 RepID=UPI0010566584|nr:hypothetical protein [Halalkalibacter urbisdiaboli]
MMYIDSEKNIGLYSDILSKILNTANWYRKHKNQSLTIPELSIILGNSEELILESMEFDVQSIQPYSLLQ